MNSMNELDSIQIVKFKGLQSYTDRAREGVEDMKLVVKVESKEAAG